MDRINANVFRQMKDKKHGKPVYNIYATKNTSNTNKKFTKPTGKYTLDEPVPGYNPNQITSGASNKGTNVVPYKGSHKLPNDALPGEEPDLYYADPNNYTPDFKTKTTINKNGVITRTNGSGITTVQALVNNPKNKNQPEAWQYKIRTKKMEDPDLDINANSLQKKQQAMSVEEKQMAKMAGKVLVNTVKQNRLTKGTQGMMDNERLHAQEAIESGIYVTWSTQSRGGQTVDCFRCGSNSMCICGHGFPNHEKILNKKKFSNKCKNCGCKGFRYIPVYPEEIGEYWIPVAPPMMMTNSPRGSLSMKCCSTSCAVPLTLSSCILLISRQALTCLSAPNSSHICSKVFITRRGDSYIIMVRGSLASSCNRVCLPFFCGRKPSKQNLSHGNPLLTSAGTNAVAPGSVCTSIPAAVTFSSSFSQ